jgi:hypothetical protein
MSMNAASATDIFMPLSQNVLRSIVFLNSAVASEMWQFVAHVLYDNSHVDMLPLFSHCQHAQM